MTPEREREIRDAVTQLIAEGHGSRPMIAAYTTLLAEVDRLRALPVIATCGECAWHRDSLGGRDCAHERGRGVVGAVSWDPAPPEWCPLRGRS